jgi:hypothetical protein
MGSATVCTGSIHRSNKGGDGSGRHNTSGCTARCMPCPRQEVHQKRRHVERKLEEEERAHASAWQLEAYTE